MPLGTARRTSVIGEVIAQLEAMISSGEWPVGTRIPPEPELVAELGVGRNSLREAVRALVHTGVLAARQGDGTYVRASSGLRSALERYLERADARHVLEARRGLEREAARLAARRRTDDDLAALDAAVDGQRAAADAGDRHAFVRADVAFHHAVATAAHNPVLADLLDHLGDALERSIAVLVGAHVDEAGDFTTAGELLVHRDLADAVRAGQAETAADASDALLDHLVATLDGGTS